MNENNNASDNDIIIDSNVDLSNGSISVTNINQSAEILRYKQREQTAYLWFKITAFICCIALGSTFLLKGVFLSGDAVEHVISMQQKQLEVIDKRLDLQEICIKNDKECGQIKIAKINSSQVKKQSQDSDQSPPPKKVTADELKPNTVLKEEKSGQILDVSMLSTGSILTIIAFILGTGLTLLLTLLKFTFNNNDNTDNEKGTVLLAGPISELIKAFSAYIKKKIS